MLKFANRKPGWVLVLLLLLSTAPPADAHKYRVSDPASARAMIASGGKLVAEYGSFQIIESDSVPVTAESVQSADYLDEIQLNTGKLNTRLGSMQVLRRQVSAFDGKRLHLVQFAGPIQPAWVEALQQRGVQIVSYIPHDAYLVYGDAAALGRVQSWIRGVSVVQWDGDFSGEYKVHPHVRAAAAARVRAAGAATDRVEVQMVVDPDANARTLALIDRVRVGPIDRQVRALRFLNVIARLPPAALDQVAAQSDVVSIQPYFIPSKADERQDQIVAGNIAGSMPSGPGYLSWLGSKGFGQGQFDDSELVVDVTDSGIDNGTMTPGHFGLYELGKTDECSRVVYARLEGTPNNPSTLQGRDGHGNLNAHILAGYSAFSGFPFADSAGYEYGLGVCPFVRVGSSVIFDPDYFTFPSYENLQSDAYANGARVSANSWGAWYSAGAYNSDAQRFDALVRDAQPTGSTHAQAGNQEMVIVFAAGNQGPGMQTVQAPGSAKNVITVGASDSVRSLTPANGGTDPAGNDGCSTPDAEADNVWDMAPYSGQGPCSDGRMKPDLVAAGTHITGGVPQNITAGTNSPGSALATFNASEIAALPGAGLCGTPMAGNTNNFFPLGQQFYTVSSGTSHAVPAVAGACALLRQYFVNHGWTPPSPAMTKACLMNSALYLTGAGAGDNLWSPSQGMGALNLGMMFDGVPRVFHDEVSGELFVSTGVTNISGGTNLFTGTICDSTKPFRVTVAWTDAPGSTSGNAYNNDLDLIVTAGGKTYLGNVFSGANSTTGGVADHQNNVESVFLPAGVSGTYAVQVVAANINSAGVPNLGQAVDQDYALVIYNAAQSPQPVVALDSANLVAENCTNGAVDPDETVSVAFSVRNVGTQDTTNLVATLLSTNGVVWPSGPQSFGALTAGGQSATQSFSFIAVGACGGFVSPVLQFQQGSSNLGAALATFPLGVPMVAPQTATNAGNIQVPASSFTGLASPYPSTLPVSGLNGAVTKVTVSIIGFTHSNVGNVDILLVGPSGTNVMLMSASGQPNGVSGVSLTFDDDAGSQLPQYGQITSGTFQPSDFSGGSISFPSPAPSNPYGSALAAFKGLNPNGNWSLYVQDQSTLDNGSIAQGWRLGITTSNVICCTGAPLPAPRFQSIALSNAAVNMAWTTIPGHVYRLQSAPSLSGNLWTNYPPDVTASNTVTTRSDPTNSARRFFYRAILLH